MQELMLGRLLNSSGLLDAVFLAGMFAVLLFRRESIAIPGMFKLAYWLFGLSIVVPACMLPFVTAVRGTFSGPLADDVEVVLSILYSGTGPALLALSVLCAFGSMFPRKMPPPPAAPTKHPLD